MPYYSLQLLSIHHHQNPRLSSPLMYTHVSVWMSGVCCFDRYKHTPSSTHKADEEIESQSLYIYNKKTMRPILDICILFTTLPHPASLLLSIHPSIYPTSPIYIYEWPNNVDDDDDTKVWNFFPSSLSRHHHDHDTYISPRWWFRFDSVLPSTCPKLVTFNYIWMNNNKLS